MQELFDRVLIDVGSVSEVYSSFFIPPPLRPTRNDGVPLKPPLLAARTVRPARRPSGAPKHALASVAPGPAR
jgi:hypothetical protein